MNQIQMLTDASLRVRWDYETDIDWAVQEKCSAKAFEDILFGDGFIAAAKGFPFPHALRHAFSEGILQDVFWGEMHSALTARKAAGLAPTRAIKRLLVLQGEEEVNHANAFNRYIQDQKCGMRAQIDPCIDVRDFMEAVIMSSEFASLMYGLSLIEQLGKVVLRQLDQHCKCPTLKQVLRRALSDEARHVEIARIVAVVPDPKEKERLDEGYERANDRTERAVELVRIAERLCGLSNRTSIA